MKEERLTSRGMTFLIRPYQPGDETALLASWEAAFGKEWSLEEWRWKYLALPHGALILLCLQGEEVVVHYAGQIVKALHQDAVFYGLHLADSFSHPRYRWAVGGRTGLFVRTARVFWKTYLRGSTFEEPGLETSGPQVDFVWGLPGERHFRLGRLLLDYGELPKGVFFAEKTPSARKKRGLFSSLKRYPLPPSPGLLKALEGLFAADFLRQGSLILAREREFLAWRYARPGASYWFLGLKGLLGGLRAGVFYTVVEGRGLILDLAARTPKDLTDLLRLLPAEVSVWQLWLPGHVEKGPFLAAGFREGPEPLGIYPAFQTYLPSCDKLRDRFFWTLSDADLF